MKKILSIVLLLLLSTPICLAEVSQGAANAGDSATEIDENETYVSDVDANESEAVENIFTNDPETNVQLQGFLEYTEPPEDAVYLRDTAYKSGLSLKAPAKLGSVSLIPIKLKQSPYSEQPKLGTASKFSNLEYVMTPTSSSYGGKMGNFSAGTMYNSSLDSAQLSYSTGIYTKYDGRHFAITTAFSKNTTSSFDSYSDKVYFAPELKITKRLSFLDIMQADVMQPTRKQEFVLRYTPPLKRFADEVQFELGAGQSFSEDKLMNTSVRFSTRFKL